MTQSRSSILLALAVLMIVVVESTQIADNVDDVVDINKDADGNQTQYDVDIQMNFIDSELKEDGKDIREIHQAEPIVIDLGREFNNKTIPTDKGNTTEIVENLENIVENEVPIDEVSTTEVQPRANETNEKVDNLEQTLETVPLKSTTVIPLEITTVIPLEADKVAILDETISTLAAENENISSINNTIANVDKTQVETQTKSVAIHQETSTNHNSKTRDDLSIYFENEPSRARQLRGFNKETNNDVLTHADNGSESDSSSNVSISSESGISPTFNITTSHEKNKAAEDSPLSDDEKSTAEPKAVSFEEATKSIAENLVEEIEAVTESIGEITNDVTVVSNEETHTIMKKPGVDDETPKNTTVGSIEEQANEIGVTRPETELDSVVNLVLNRPKAALEPSATTIASTENESSDGDISNKNKQFDDVEAPLAVTEKSNSDEAQIPKIDEISETKSLLASEILDKSKEFEENSNSVDFNVELPSNPDNKLTIDEQITLPNLQESLKAHPENASSTQNNELSSELNVINDDKTDNVETSTQAPSHEIKEPSLFENTHKYQPSKEENGIFKDIKEYPLNSTEEPLADILIHENAIETSTKIPADGKIEGQMKTLLEKNETGTITDNVTPVTTTDESFPAKINDKTSNGLTEEPLSGLNNIPNTETNYSKDHKEISTQSPSINRYEPELLGEVQDDQTSATDNGIFKKPNEARQNPTDESLPDPKHYENSVETSTEKPSIYKINDPPTNQFETTDYARHVDSLQTMRDESSSVVSDEVIAPASVGRSFNEVIAEGLGKPLPTRSLGDEPSSSSFSSEDKTTTVLVLCAAAGGIFIAFSFAIYLISFQRQHGTLDIEMQEQQCGKDNLDDDDDSETRVSLLNQIPTADSDEHSSD